MLKLGARRRRRWSQQQQLRSLQPPVSQRSLWWWRTETKSPPCLCEWVNSHGLQSARGALTVCLRVRVCARVCGSPQCFSAFQGKESVDPRTFTLDRELQTREAEETVMKALRDYFPLLLLVVAVVTEPGAKGKMTNYLLPVCLCVYLFVFNSVLVLNERALNTGLYRAAPKWDVSVVDLCLRSAPFPPRAVSLHVLRQRTGSLPSCDERMMW